MNTIIKQKYEELYGNRGDMVGADIAKVLIDCEMPIFTIKDEYNNNNRTILIWQGNADINRLIRLNREIIALERKWDVKIDIDFEEDLDEFFEVFSW